MPAGDDVLRINVSAPLMVNVCLLCGNGNSLTDLRYLIRTRMVQALSVVW